MGDIKAEALDIEILNTLIDKGDRFYVTSDDSPIYDDSLWSPDVSFWGGEQSYDEQQCDTQSGPAGIAEGDLGQ